jgi:hypothetical protein
VSSLLYSLRQKALLTLTARLWTSVDPNRQRFAIAFPELQARDGCGTFVVLEKATSVLV